MSNLLKKEFSSRKKLISSFYFLIIPLFVCYFAAIGLTSAQTNEPPVANSNGINDLLLIPPGSSPGTTITFTNAVSTLLANDIPGTSASESSQTLTITAISAASGAAMSVSGNDILYTIPIGATSPLVDNFTYTIMDNGTTNGTLDPRSAMGTGTVRDCFISSDGLANVTCDNNNTPPNPNDDFISFTLNPMGVGVGASYNVTVNNGTINPTSANYNTATTFQLQADSPGAGNVTVTIVDGNNNNCTRQVTIVDPGACAIENTIPTMSQWGLLIFGLLILNLSVFFVQRREMI